MSLPGLERVLLEAAATGYVLEEPESAPAVGAAYRRLDTEGLIAAEWFGDDVVAIEVEATPASRCRCGLAARTYRCLLVATSAHPTPVQRTHQTPGDWR
jgi:hypothetical protein